jgi:predicted metalloprotease with PDZ domain
MKYVVSYKDSERHFIDFKLIIDSKGLSKIKLQLPSWRPGRYELGNFAKNIKDFNVLCRDNKKVRFSKKTKDLWELECQYSDQIIITYSYYAHELNAGSTYLDGNQLYINPVNCMFYNSQDTNLEYEIEFKLPSDFKIYTSLENTGNNTLKATNFDQLADSPIIASNSAQQRSLTINNINFSFCFQGEVKVNWEKMLKDFTSFINYQINIFGSFPHKKFLFLFQITPYSSYHGVEHHHSTVILLGPSYDVFKNLYKELLGVSSHELYHVWNVKGIRPSDMLPYDFSKENYTEMGYVTEGVTTYMGDRILYESGVFSTDQYFKELEKLFQRHFHSDGRNHYSVSESSFDTWLDGYVQGIPGRKVSIYIEGALIALICDAKIRKGTGHKKSLHDVMRAMYSGSKEITSYDMNDYKSTLEAISGESFSSIFDKIIYGKEDFMDFLEEAFKVFGWKFSVIKSENISWQLGLKTYFKNGHLKVLNVLENSAGHNSKIIKEDEILAVNDFRIDNNLEHWLNYFENDNIVLKVSRNGKILDINMNSSNDIQYFKYKCSEE